MSIRATVIGRLGADPETKTLQSGKTVTNFRVATDHGFGEKKTVTWVRVAWWGEQAVKVSQHLKKGSGVIFTGELFTRDHEGKTYVELDARDFEFRPGAAKEQGGAGNYANAGSGGSGGNASSGGFSDDDPPF